MFHELLLALRGHAGGIFIIERDGNLKVLKDLPFIHPSEEELLNSMCKLGHHYRFFQDFIRKNSACPIIAKKQENGLQPGQYLKAFVDGLDIVLEPYRQTLLDLETQIVHDPHLTAAHIQCQLQKYYLLFPPLRTIINEICKKKGHGCGILEILHTSAGIGIPSVQKAVEKMQYVCHGVLYRQLAVWMLHGMLLDSHKEFFIHKVAPSKPLDLSPPEDDELGLGGLSGRQLQQLLRISDEAPFASHHEEFSIRPEMLPDYISLRVAEKILFVGESVQMFESERKMTSYQKCGSILKDSEEEFSRELHVLSMMLRFDEQKFEDVINRIRTCVAEHLWTLVVKESSLFGQLRILKDFFLLGRGELFLAFIDKAQTLLLAPPTITTQHDANVKLHQAARSVLLEDEALMRKFQMVIEARDLPKRAPTRPESYADKNIILTSDSAWNLLGMTYSVDWPLHILFTSGVMEKYNIVFKFLLAVKRVQLELQKCWAHQMQQKHCLSSDRDVIKWLLRTHMAFLVNNLQYYLQVDVIESLYTILLDKIHSTRDFEQVRLAHDHFITSLLSQTFQLMKPVSHCLHELLDTCHNFSSLVSQTATMGHERELEQLETLAKTFQRQSNLLFRILSSVRSHQASPHLAQLLLRIDFNKYFSLSGGQLGNYSAVELGNRDVPNT